MPELDAKFSAEHVFNFSTILATAKPDQKLAFGDPRALAGGDAEIYRLLGKDMKECLFGNAGPEVWDALDQVYKQAWYDEIRRRLRGRELNLLNSKAIGDETRFILKKAALHGGSAMPSALYFSQFKCNSCFQSAYDNSPPWIAGNPILEVAKQLKDDVGKSVDFRISVSWIGRRWIAWNNRGFTAHCLANAMPARIVPNPAPSVDERSRLGEVIEIRDFRYADATPESRRSPSHWEATAPCTVISVVDGGNGKDVIYTVKNGFARDNGNQNVLNIV